MSRLRVTLSGLPIDREIAAKVDAAKRLLVEAARSCDPRKEMDPMARRRMMAVRRDLDRALAALSGVRRVGVPGAGLEEETPSEKPRRERQPEPAVETVDTTEDG